MASVDEIVAAINGVREKYEEAQQALAAVAADTESTMSTLASLGAEKTAELLGGVKDDLDTIVATSTGVATALEAAAQAAEASKG